MALNIFAYARIFVQQRQPFIFIHQDYRAKKSPNGTRTHSGIKWILSSISYPTFFPQLPQNAIPAFNGVPHSEQKRGFTLSSAGAGVGADSLSAIGSDAGSATASVTGAVTGVSTGGCADAYCCGTAVTVPGVTRLSLKSLLKLLESPLNWV